MPGKATTNYSAYRCNKWGKCVNIVEKYPLETLIK